MDLIKKVFGLFTDENYKNKYKVISVIGACVRYGLFWLLQKTLISQLGITLTIITHIGTFILNYLIEKPLHHFTYLEVGIGYKGGNATLGSILYTVFYAINCAAIFIIVWFYKFWIYYFCIVAYIILVMLCRGVSFLITKE